MCHPTEEEQKSACAQSTGLLHFTREEALALLSLCMLAPNQIDTPAESGLMKLAEACRTFLSQDEEGMDIQVASGERL
jgi:hypothetical protein